MPHLSIKHIRLRFIRIHCLYKLCLLFLIAPVWGQFNIATDIYIGQGGDLYVAVEKTTFQEGFVTTARGENYGLISFAADAQWEAADNASHVDGYVRMYADDTFSFPLGDEGIFQPAHIERIDQSSPVDLSFSLKPFNTVESEVGIRRVSDQFYWEVKGSMPAYVSLSWHAFSQIDQLTNNDLGLLSIAGFDGIQWRTIDSEVTPTAFYDESPSTLLSGSIRSKTPINLESYEALTLVKLEEDEIELNVSQGFTPNGDGINDTWYIENIDRYPNAHIIVYSRWELEVFEARNGYKNDWNGVYKDNVEPLPDGSYAYVIDLEGDGKMDVAGWIYITR